MKKLWILVLVGVVLVTLGACSDADAEDPEASIDTLIVYSNQTSGGRGTQLKTLIEDADFDFEVEFVELSGQNLKNRLIGEKDAPIADVVLGGGMLEHIELKNEGITKPFFPEWLDKVDDVHLDDDGYHSPWAIEPLYLVYNQEHYTNDKDEANGAKKHAPADYEDLVENYQGEYNVFKPSSGTGATIYASILSEYRDEQGDLGVSEEGWSLLGDLINGGEVDRGLWQQNLAGDEKPIAMTWSGAIFDIEQAYGVEIGRVVPDEGVPFVVSQVAVVDSSNAAREQAAEEFIEWWGTTETQVAWSDISGQAPANNEAFDLVDEEIRDMNEAEPIELDWPFIVERMSEWRQKIELDLIEN